MFIAIIDADAKYTIFWRRIKLDQFLKGVGVFFNNEWTITIIGGLLLTGIIKVGEKLYSLSKADKDVKNANKEVVDFLEKVITNKTELSLNFLDVIMSSIARKNDVLIKRMNSKVEAIEDVMLKLYKIDYLSMDEKNEMIKKLIAMKLELQSPSVLNIDSIENRDDGYMKEERRSLNSKKIIREILPMYLAVVSVMVTVMYTLIITENPKKSDLTLTTEGMTIMLILMLLLMCYLFIMYILLQKKMRKKSESKSALNIRYKNLLEEQKNEDKKK